MIYVLKGSITTEIEGHGVHTMKAGDSWLQPQSIMHKVLDYSDGCEVLEIVMPANSRPSNWKSNRVLAQAGSSQDSARRRR